MPKGPQGQKRPADVIGNAIMVAKIATGEIAEGTGPKKESAAAELGRKGGVARAEKLSKRERRDIAKIAAKARWNKNR